MEANKKILLTGAAGFIGSYLLGYLNEKGFENIYIVDAFDNEKKEQNFHQKKFIEKIERDQLFDWLEKTKPTIDFVFHLGARTDTTEFDYAVHEKLNVIYSQKIWHYCAAKKIPLVYASSAATYGDGSLGYKDDHALIQKLQPLNPYGISKNEFDKWALATTEIEAPPFWAGLKFFNVYGPNEYHKGRMASMIFHGYHQIMASGSVKLFKSHRSDYANGEQLRDFIYVKDLAEVCFWFLQEQPTSGLYNLGTGTARSFKDLIAAVFTAVGKPTNIQYIDMPEDIRDKYQYFTEADMQKLRKTGYTAPFHSLEEGVKEYVQNFL
ncbi:MAG TPA: ADP-glyceromanno-heptose 6-epimerase, partial [Chitinophagaceae bacterium]|nr:ADP-glyceromanno-heptose 6-epimerase [Chitinophagaceae bacterium]